MSDFTPTTFDPAQTMSNILGIQQKRQALQIGQAQLQSAQAEAQGKTRVQNEYTAAANLLRNKPDATDEEVSAVAPTVGIEINQNRAALQKAHADVNSALTELSSKNKGQAADLVRSLQGGEHTPDQIHAMIDAAETINPQLKGVFEPMRPYIEKLPPPGDARTAALGNFATMLDGNSGVKADSQDTGGALVNSKVDSQGNRAYTGTGLKKAPPPGFSIVEDPVTHNKYTVQNQTGATAPLGSTAPQNAPPQRQIGEAEAEQQQVDVNFKNHQANIDASSAANQQLDQIHKVQGLLRSGVKLGTGSQTLADAESVASKIPGLEGLAGAGSEAVKRELVNKYLERIGAQFGSLNGSPAKTDAGAEALRAQVGSVGYNADTLKEVMNYTEAQYKAAQSKERAEQAFFKQPGNGIRNQHEFETLWRNNYDPRIFQMSGMSKEDAKTTLSNMTPDDRASFLQKYARLKAAGAAPQ